MSGAHMAAALVAAACGTLGPPIIIGVKHRWPNEWTRRINVLIACYALGIVIGNCGIQNPTTYAVVNQLATGAVVLSLPLLLFSTDLRQVRKKGLSVFFALFVGAVAVVASATACHFVFRSRLTPEAWKITALMTAVLIGGTPNMASVRTALGIDSELYVTVHTAEVVVGAVYVLLIMTVAKPVLSRVLPPYKPLASAAKADAVPGRELEPVASILEGGEAGPEPECAVEPKQAGDESGEPGGSCCTGGDNSGDSDAMAATAHDLTRLQDGVEPYAELTRREFAVPLVGAVALDLLIVLVSAGAGLLFQPYGYFELVTILLITTLSVAASCAERLRRIRHTFTLGQLFILVFCLSVGMLADLKTLAGTSPWVFAFVAAVMVCSVALQVLFFRLTAVDVDTGIVASVQLFCSPPFIGIACQAVNNTELLLPGISAGLVGYALGNYIGSGTGKLWENLAP